MASQIATKKSKRNPPEICGDAFVVVTVEEIELSLSSVVALPSDDEDEGSDAVLEARAALGGAAQRLAAGSVGASGVALSARDLPMRGGAPKPTTKKDASEQQSRRDIERDCLVVDGGAPLQGGRVGYDRIVDAIAAAQARLVARAAADEWRPVDGAESSDFAKAALRAVNRTESAARRSRR
ncbi:hypothetical protein JL721_1401 [Aureococcus anophagefferens]|nr:hypothetical protein JL721_1401 [Aureococcus anophagefferens]